MKKIVMLLALIATCVVANAQNAPIEVTWTMGSNNAQPEGERMKYSSTFTVKNVGKKSLGKNWKFYFNHLDRSPQVTTPNSALKIEKFRPGYYVLCPDGKNYRNIAPGDSIVVEFLCSGRFNSDSFRPDGGHYVKTSGSKESKPIGVDIKVPVYTNPCQWIAKGREADFYPTGENMYRLNQLLNPAGAIVGNGAFDIFPTPKNITYFSGNASFKQGVKIEGEGRAATYLAERLAACGIATNAAGSLVVKFEQCTESNNPEFYRLTVADGSVTIASSGDDGALNGVKTLMAAIERQGVIGTLPNAVVTDFPDLSHRGMMLDIARNFIGVEDIKRFIDAIAMYKINVFHFHFSDDEGWRLEIPGLPELTEVGARRGLTRDESRFLMQSYAGSGNPDDKTSSNGHLTRAEFIDMLRYAQARGVEVIPEIESPGHARAAIVAMKARYNRLKKSNREAAEQYMMWDPEDKSEYTSVQGYNDNVMNFATPGTYRFIEKVVDEIVAIYNEAQVKLNTIHIGGDEVPKGAWEGSPIARKFLKQHNYTSVKMGAEHFIDCVSRMIASKGVGVGGWQEVAMNHTEEYNANVAPRFNRVTVWNTIGQSAETIPYTLANSGFPVVLCNVSNLYFDLVYNWHPQEKGLNWGGAVDEFSAWSILPYNSYRSARFSSVGKQLDFRNADKGKVTLKNRENICGIQAQLFSETLRDFEMVSMYVFPRLFGLAERGWNASPSWAADDDDTRYNAERAQFNLKIGVELHRLASRNLNFHLGQPGVMIMDGKIVTNTQYPGEVVRYTTDGSEPTENSPVWTSPIATQATVVKAKSYYLGRCSNTSTFTR